MAALSCLAAQGGDTLLQQDRIQKCFSLEKFGAFKGFLMAISVSIIEDEDLIREHFVALISASNHCKLAETASNGRAAKGVIERNLADVYLVDLGLPDIDGVELISLIKTSCAEAQTMVLSTLGDVKHMERSIRAGATGYLLKDHADCTLIEKIVELHNGECPVSPSLVRCLFNSIASRGGSRAIAPSEEFQKFSLSSRETAVMHMLVCGLPVVSIADELNVSSHTINQYLRSIYRKLNVHSRSKAVAVAIQNGFLDV